jgi:L-serine dehydratase
VEAGSGFSIAGMKLANERAIRGDDVEDRIDAVWQAMTACIDRGLAGDGEMQDGLRVRRRARGIHEQLKSRALTTAPPCESTEWLSVVAMTINEENAAGGGS